MVTRIRIEAQGGSAARVEQDLRRVLSLIWRDIDSQAVRGEQMIHSSPTEPLDSNLCFEGRMLVYLNTHPGSEQLDKLKALDPVANHWEG